MSANLSEHARVALLIGLPRVGRPKSPTPDPAPFSPAGSLFDGPYEEDVPELDLDNSEAEQTSSANHTSSAPTSNHAPTPNAIAPTIARWLVRTHTAQPENSQMAYNEGAQDVLVEEMRMLSVGPLGGTHSSTSHYALYPQPVEIFNGSSATGASASHFSGAYIPPLSMPGSVSGQKHTEDAMEIDDEVQGI